MRINFIPQVEASRETFDKNVAACTAPKIKLDKSNVVASVVGGGQSASHLRFIGDVLAINNTYYWLQERGVNCAMVSIDPLLKPKGRIKKAYLASCCDPELFAACDEVYCFDLIEYNKEGIGGGVTTATRAPSVALNLGYKRVYFYGCEGNFKDQDHVDRHDGGAKVVIRANGKDYITYPEFLIQSESLALLLETFPEFFVNHSGGMLEAMQNDSDWECVAVCEEMRKGIEEYSGECLFNQPYEVRA